MGLHYTCGHALEVWRESNLFEHYVVHGHWSVSCSPSGVCHSEL